MQIGHVASEPAILYFGTPVLLISTVNEDGSYNLAPNSSAFWLGWRCILGLDASSKTTENIMRTGECVLNLPSIDCVAAVNRLARTAPVSQSNLHCLKGTESCKTTGKTKVRTSRPLTLLTPNTRPYKTPSDFPKSHLNVRRFPQETPYAGRQWPCSS